MATVQGRVTDKNNKPIYFATVAVSGTQYGTTTDSLGNYSLTIPANEELIVAFQLINYQKQEQKVKLTVNEVITINKQLVFKPGEILTITVYADKRKNPFETKINPRLPEVIAGPPSIEAGLKFSGLVFIPNELSTQYNVRGGSFDENLVYVNDVEVYRPFLVRSGQQEGLSFINPDLADDVSFSAGGFNARYGDKLSSVLDVKYKKPKDFRGSFNGSLLGGSFHIEGISKDTSLSYLLGVRQKSNQYLLNSLDTKGEFRPSATDVQTYIIYELNKRNSISFLGNYTQNKYNVIPTDRQTEFGTVNEALRLSIYFEGQETDKFNSGTAAVTFKHTVNDKLNFRLITSAFSTVESESYDILGQYFLDQLENDFGSSDFGDSAINRGIGSFLTHARNKLKAQVYNAELRTNYVTDKFLFWGGIKVQDENITDKLSEWYYLDSAGYSIPGPFDNVIELNNVVKTKNNLNSNRFSAFVECQQYLDSNKRFTINYGLRSNYWTVNKQNVISPRISASYRRNRFLFKMAAGYYYQPPFYRELRDARGVLNKDLKAQRSIHFVIGSEYTFLMWGREFKFVSEAYYKNLSSLVPFKTEDLRLRYFANNNSTGYAYGADFRLNGEFVPGAESWFSVNYLRTFENLKDDKYYDYYNAAGEQILGGYTFDQVATDSIVKYPGNIPRPTDQRVTFSILFQDYLPKFPKYKVYLNLLFGSGLPFGPPGDFRYKDIFRYPPYRRVDIGFSRTLIDEEENKRYKMKLLNRLRSLSISLEVFNLLQVNNTISYLWITDITNRQYAVPNYLTSRQLNLRVIGRF